MDHLAVAVEGGRIGELAAGVGHIAATQIQPIYHRIQPLIFPLHDVKTGPGQTSQTSQVQPIYHNVQPLTLHLHDVIEVKLSDHI